MGQHADDGWRLQLSLRSVVVLHLLQGESIGLAGGRMGVHHQQGGIGQFERLLNLGDLFSRCTALAVAGRVQQGDRDRRFAERRLIPRPNGFPASVDGRLDLPGQQINQARTCPN